MNSEKPPTDRARLPKLMRAPDVAAALGCTEGHARKLMREGYVPARRFRSFWVADRDELLRVVLRRTSMEVTA